jgi:hypothetical protein
MRNLGQPLKSFRDSKVHFEVYDPRLRDLSRLDELGALEKPQRASAARVAAAAEPETTPAPAQSPVAVG